MSLFGTFVFISECHIKLISELFLSLTFTCNQNLNINMARAWRNKEHGFQEISVDACSVKYT